MEVTSKIINNVVTLNDNDIGVEKKEIDRIYRTYYSNNIFNDSIYINNEMKDIIIYGNMYVRNDIILNYNYNDYLKICVDVEQKGLLNIPYNQIIVVNGMVKKTTGSIHQAHKLFQFKCRLYNIPIDLINNILKKMNEKDFYYTNWKYADFSRDTNLSLFTEKSEKLINNMLLLSVGEINPKYFEK